MARRLNREDVRLTFPATPPPRTVHVQYTIRSDGEAADFPGKSGTVTLTDDGTRTTTQLVNAAMAAIRTQESAT